MNASSIFDAMMAADSERQRVRRIRELQNEIRAIGTVCGDCDLWMKSRQCPREHNVAGMSRGPSCGAPRCERFIESWHAAEHRNRLSVELARQGEK